MAFSDDTRKQAFIRAKGQCQCERLKHPHPGRCNAMLGANWHAHHRTAVAAGGDDSLANCEALCVECHKDTGTYGTKS